MIVGTRDERSQWCNRLLLVQWPVLSFMGKEAAMTNRRLSRKELLEIGAAAGVALSGSGIATLLSKEAGAITSFTPYMVSLPIPPKAVKDAVSGAYKLTVDQSKQAMHPKLTNVN